MKKLLNISVIAALAVLPLAANAAPVAGEPINIATQTPTGQTADNVTASAEPKYQLAEANEDVDGVLATAGYVKGAYNAAIKAVNKVAETASNALTADGTATLTNKTIDADNNTIQDLTTSNFKTGTVVTSVGATGSDSALPSEKAVRSAITTATSGMVTTDGTQTLTNKTISGGTVSGATITGGTIDADSTTISNLETDNLKSGTLVISTTGIAASESASDTKLVSEKAAAAAIEGSASTATYNSATNYGANTVGAAIKSLQTASGDYATKTGVETTVTGAFTGATANLSGLGVTNNAVTGTATASVPVVTTWGATTAGTPISATVDLTNVSSNVALTGNTTGAVTAGTIAYPAN